MPVVDATVVIDGRGSGVAGGATVAAAGRPVEPVLAPELLGWNAPASWPPAFAAGRWSGADADAAYAVLTGLPPTWSPTAATWTGPGSSPGVTTTIRCDDMLRDRRGGADRPDHD